MEVSSHSFDFLRTFLREESAIVLDPGKRYLIEMRLEPLLRTHGWKDLDELVVALKSDRRFHGEVVDALSTHETFFFRDTHPFEALRDHVLPDLLERNRDARELNVWSAASASGQEPYSIAMTMLETAPELRAWDLWFLATDISAQMVARAKAGRYSQLEVNRGLPAQMLIKYFSRDGSSWRVKPALRDMIAFEQLNLIRNWPRMPKLDLVFIRNVLIYFDTPTRQTVLARLRECLRPGGYVFLGGAETTIGIDLSLEKVVCGPTVCYRRSERTNRCSTSTARSAS